MSLTLMALLLRKKLWWRVPIWFSGASISPAPDAWASSKLSLRPVSLKRSSGKRSISEGPGMETGFPGLSLLSIIAFHSSIWITMAVYHL
jgi:hypothetical protein